jgi:hypothetical protein
MRKQINKFHPHFIVKLLINDTVSVNPDLFSPLFFANPVSKIRFDTELAQINGYKFQGLQ